MTDNQTCQYCGEWTGACAAITYKGHVYLEGYDSVQQYHAAAKCVEGDEPYYVQ